MSRADRAVRLQHLARIRREPSLRRTVRGNPRPRQPRGQVCRARAGEGKHVLRKGNVAPTTGLWLMLTWRGSIPHPTTNLEKKKWHQHCKLSPMNNIQG